MLADLGYIKKIAYLAVKLCRKSWTASKWEQVLPQVLAPSRHFLELCKLHRTINYTMERLPWWKQVQRMKKLQNAPTGKAPSPHLIAQETNFANGKLALKHKISNKFTRVQPLNLLFFRSVSLEGSCWRSTDCRKHWNLHEIFKADIKNLQSTWFSHKFGFKKRFLARCSSSRV